MNIAELRERRGEINDQSTAIVAGADKDSRDLTDQERGKLKEYRVEFERVTEEIEAREIIEKQTEELAKPAPRLLKPVDPVNSPADLAQTIGTSTDLSANATAPVYATAAPARGSYGWRSFGEFCQGVRRAGLKGGDYFVDNRLRAHSTLAPTTVTNEGVGADGGFALPPDFRAGIVSTIEGEDSFLPLTDQNVTSSNHTTIPIDETTPWQTSGGIQAYWEGENANLTQSKVALEQNTVRLNKVTVLVPVTDEQLEDAPALGSYLGRKAPEKMLFKVNLAILQGTGVGMPMGLLNSPALVSVSKTASQDADTVVAQNIIDMWSRMYAPSRRTGVWFINQDIEPMILTMSQPGKDITGTAVDGYGSLVYMPPGGLSGAPFGTLMGKRVIPTQACETLGDKGDIFFADLKQYMTVQKVGGIRAETSIHLWFDYDTTAFRFILRVGGLPWWQSTASARDGTTTYSPFVTLNERG